MADDPISPTFRLWVKTNLMQIMHQSRPFLTSEAIEEAIFDALHEIKRDREQHEREMEHEQ